MSRVFLPAILPGPLLWAAFFPLDLGPLAFVALVPWLTLVRADVSRRRRYLAAYLGGLLKQHGVEGDRLVLEITEQLAVRFAARTDKQIALLRDLGCELAIDDFGTGYSSFGYLKRLPVDYLKIDGSFIRGLARDRVDQAAVRMIGEVARAAGIETVAEYVTSAATFELLAKYGIDYAQGYFIGKPAAAPEPSSALSRMVATCTPRDSGSVPLAASRSIRALL